MRMSTGLARTVVIRPCAPITVDVFPCQLFRGFDAPDLDAQIARLPSVSDSSLQVTAFLAYLKTKHRGEEGLLRPRCGVHNGG